MRDLLRFARLEKEVIAIGSNSIAVSRELACGLRSIGLCGPRSPERAAIA